MCRWHSPFWSWGESSEEAVAVMAPAYPSGNKT